MKLLVAILVFVSIILIGGALAGLFANAVAETQDAANAIAIVLGSPMGIFAAMASMSVYSSLEQR